MKKQIIIAVCLLISTFAATAQMTLEHEYTGLSNDLDVTNTGFLREPMSVVNLLLSGKKYAVQKIASSQVLLYNLDHSLWKTINLPSIPNCIPNKAYYISENLFKIDGHVDMAVEYRDTSVYLAASGNLIKQVIIDELGTILNNIDSFSAFTVFDIGTDTFKAIMGNWTSNTFYPVVTNYRVYALPGTLPCNVCGNGYGTSVPNVTNVSTGMLSAPVPNPSNGKVRVSYKLPYGINQGVITIFNANGQQVKRFNVDNSTQYIDMDNSELPSGVYYYNLSAVGMETTAKKMVIIK